MDQMPLVVSFYTKGTDYEQEAAFLKSSCDDLNLEHHIQGVDDLGSWEKNCCYKPQFLKRLMMEKKRALLWVDCDAVIVKPPYIFNAIEEDIAVKYSENLPSNHPSKVITATLFLQNRPNVLALLSDWEKACVKALGRDKKVWDQEVLKYELARLKKEISIYPLQDAYSQIYDKITAQSQLLTAHIVQFQASRIQRIEHAIPAIFKQLYFEHKASCIQAIKKAQENG